MKQDKIEKILASVAGNMWLSGFMLTEDDKMRIRDLATNSDAVEAELQRLIKKHKNGKENYDE